MLIAFVHVRILRKCIYPKPLEHTKFFSLSSASAGTGNLWPFWPYTNTGRNYPASHICNSIISLQGASNKYMNVFPIPLQYSLPYSEVLYKFHYFSHVRGHSNSQCYWTGWCFFIWLPCDPGMSHIYLLPEIALQITSQPRKSLSQSYCLAALSKTSKLAELSLWFSVSLFSSLSFSEDSIQHSWIIFSSPSPTLHEFTIHFPSCSTLSPFPTFRQMYNPNILGYVAVPRNMFDFLGLTLICKTLRFSSSLHLLITPHLCPFPLSMLEIPLAQAFNRSWASCYNHGYFTCADVLLFPEHSFLPTHLPYTTMHTLTPSSLLCTVDIMWLAASTSGHLDFSTMMGYLMQLWDK